MAVKTINGIAVKPTLRKLSEMAIVSVLGRVPRNIRRAAATTYANEAWRELRGLKPLNQKANRQIVEWVAKEFKKFVESQKNGKPMDVATGVRNDRGSTADGPEDGSPEVSIRHVAEDEGSGASV